MRYDDEALLRFAFLWIRFSLFGEPTMRVRADVAEAFKGKLEKKELSRKQPSGEDPAERPPGGAVR